MTDKKKATDKGLTINEYRNMQGGPSANEWEKIRSDYKKWTKEVLWVIPNKVYYGLAIVLFIALCFSKSWKYFFLAGLIWIVSKLVHREAHEEGYMDGFRDGIDHGVDKALGLNSEGGEVFKRCVTEMTDFYEEHGIRPEGKKTKDGMPSSEDAG